ncbi:hypothetical protein ORG37_02750 [Rahnella perminowiae]|uniref:hypothetical protein n=1 Tax=Rahnella perminowiae TaxID=2816244 RepID=UPI00224A7BA0|nr:hypothetical protein [Rahnella perminowiae]MCX2942026.1 hypothetical protein [Rahnella perminowiae]
MTRIWRTVRGDGHLAGKAGLKSLTIVEEKTSTITPILAAWYEIHQGEKIEMNLSLKWTFNSQGESTG